MIRNKKIKRAVIKIGSNLLINNNQINEQFINKLCQKINNLKANGIECILVSSGSIGCGFNYLNLNKSKLSVPEKQAAAAIGQSRLIGYYSAAFAEFNITAAQLLVTHDDIQNRLRYLNIKNTVATLLESNIIPIFNENDTVAVDEITFGDNDYLSALITHLVQADILILLSTIDGLIDFSSQQDNKVISDVTNIDNSILSLIQDTKSIYGTGGMTSKITAAQKLMQTGHLLAILNGQDLNSIDKLFNNQKIGTVFYPNNNINNQKKLWIGFAGKAKGNILIDEGAAQAIINSHKSLLPIGITNADGNFNRGDIINILYNNKTIAKGQSNYDLSEVNKIKQLKTNQIEQTLGHKPYDEIVHIDNMVIL